MGCGSCFKAAMSLVQTYSQCLYLAILWFAVTQTLPQRRIPVDLDEVLFNPFLYVIPTCGMYLWCMYTVLSLGE